MELSKKYLDLVSQAKQNINELSIDETMIMIKNKEPFVLIDVREESEWKDKRIPNSIYLGKGIIEREIEGSVPDENTKIVLYCGGGYRSALSAVNLQKMGYKNVYSLMGGISEWEDKKLSLERNKIGKLNYSLS